MANSTIPKTPYQSVIALPNGVDVDSSQLANGIYRTDGSHLPQEGVPSGFNENGSLVKFDQSIFWTDIFGTFAVYNRYYNVWRILG